MIEYASSNLNKQPSSTVIETELTTSNEKQAPHVQEMLSKPLTITTEKMKEDASSTTSWHESKDSASLIAFEPAYDRLSEAKEMKRK